MSDRLTQILLIDDDPIFRLGLRTALAEFPHLQVVAEADTTATALEILGRRQNPKRVDLVVLELQLAELSLCQQLKTDYPELPILLLTAQSDPTQLAVAQEAGVDGYCSKGSAIDIIVRAISQLTSGESFWETLPALSESMPNSVPSPRWHHQLRSQGLRQIEEALVLVKQKLQSPHLTNLDRLFWNGRRRELLAARWLVNQLLPAQVIVVERGRGGRGDAGTRGRGDAERRSVGGQGRQGGQGGQGRNSRFPISPQQALLVPSPGSGSELTQVLESSQAFDATLTKLQSDLTNCTGVVLEIDILQTDKKRDLLGIILHKVEENLADLRFSQVTIEQLAEKRSLILQDVWQESVIDFFGKYYTLSWGNQELAVVDVLLRDAAAVKGDILDKIPFVVELFAHQLFEEPLIIDNVSYPAQTPEALSRSGILLQNLIIQLANGVISPLLNHFADVETIKQSFYNRRLISSRDIARFRNNLSWRYRKLQLLDEPEAIFESRHHLLVLTDTGIKPTDIYAPRTHELARLQGLSLVVSIAYELRDAIAPRLQATVAWIGRGVVYFLTQVIGKGIGLIVRGVIQGVGSAWQDPRLGK
ncbi:MAG: DUF3685 domain-containing protein [Symploca sp. SIO2E6]|nr:DUF3685 domain-containing protein [Symploca sp. SIO2E6]